MAINLDQYTNTLSVTDTATNADLTLVPKGTGQTKATNLTSSIVSSVGQSGYGSFLAQGSTGNAAYYFGYVGSSEVGRITMTGNTDLGTSSAATLQLRVAHTASAVNYVQVTGAATSASPTISAQGSDTNIDLSLTPKGTGAVNANMSGFGEGFKVINGSNYFRINGFSSGTISAMGFESTVAYGNIFTGNVAIKTAATVTQLNVAHTASAVNYVQVTGSVTSPGAGTIPTISVQGSDASTYLGIGFKGTGGYVSFYNNGAPGAATTLFRVRSIAGTIANYISAYPAIAGGAPFFGSEGGDTNIDLTLTPKGTGNVRFGTHTGTADTAVSGYIEIKDSGGTIRKLAVIT